MNTPPSVTLCATCNKPFIQTGSFEICYDCYLKECDDANNIELSPSFNFCSVCSKPTEHIVCDECNKVDLRPAHEILEEQESSIDTIEGA